jgi:hypothetical protein
MTKEQVKQETYVLEKVERKRGNGREVAFPTRAHILRLDRVWVIDGLLENRSRERFPTDKAAVK